MSKQIELGDLVKDIVTGFQGVATTRSEYINGCVQYYVRPQKLHEGKRIDGCWLDEGQLKVVERAAVTVTATSPARPKSPGGGVRPHPHI